MQANLLLATRQFIHYDSRMQIRFSNKEQKMDEDDFGEEFCFINR